MTVGEPTRVKADAASAGLPVNLIVTVPPLTAMLVVCGVTMIPGRNPNWPLPGVIKPEESCISSIAPMKVRGSVLAPSLSG